MSRRTRIYASAHGPSQPLDVALQNGEVLTHYVDWNAVLGATGATISSSSWTVESGATCVALSGSTSSDGVAETKFTAATTGRCVITNSVTLSNSEVREEKFLVQVRDTLAF
jgi:hypothetical protein